MRKAVVLALHSVVKANSKANKFASRPSNVLHNDDPELCARSTQLN
jgi:hypothetical protein